MIEAFQLTILLINLYSGMCYATMQKCLSCYCRVKKGEDGAALDYLRSGDAKNFPWRENPTADLLLLPNLQ